METEVLLSDLQLIVAKFQVLTSELGYGDEIYDAVTRLGRAWLDLEELLPVGRLNSLRST